MHDVDVLVIAALPEELAAAREAALADNQDGSGVARWEPRNLDGSPYLWGEYLVEGTIRFTVALARPTHMGGRVTGTFAATMADRLSPAALAMCGVCAGNPEETALGDVVVGEPVYEWDEGKYSPSGFHGDHRQIPMHDQWLFAAQEFDPTGLPSYGDATEDEALLWLLEQLHRGQQPRNHPALKRYFPTETWLPRLARLEDNGLIVRESNGTPVLTPAGSDYVRRRLHDDVDGPQRLPFRVLTAPMASGNAVISDPSRWGKLKAMGVRKIAAIEMEAATIATIAHAQGLPWLVAKGVMDHADTKKDDRYKQFAARASAQVMFALLAQLMGGEDAGARYASRPAEQDSSTAVLDPTAGPSAPQQSLDPAYAEALILAAVDIKRLGYQGQLTEELLEAAAPGYLTGAQRASAPADWCQRALAVATHPRRRVAAALLPAGDGTMGNFTAYTVSEEVYGRLKRDRRSERPPASVWDALVKVANDKESLWRLAEAAQRRMLYQYEERFWRPLADTGTDHRARGDRDRLLIRQRRFDLLSGVGVSYETADVLVPALCAEHRETFLFRLADKHEVVWRCYLRHLRNDHNVRDIDASLRLLSSEGYRWADKALRDIQPELDRIAETQEMPGRSYARRVDLRRSPNIQPLLDEGRIDDAVGALLAAAEDSDERSGDQAINLLLDNDRRDEALDVLRRAAAGHRGWWREARSLLIAMLAADGNIEELRERADAGEGEAARKLAELLAAAGQTDELRERADRGSESAAKAHLKLLASQHRLSELAAEVDAGTDHAAHLWCEVLTSQRPDPIAECKWAGWLARLSRFGLSSEYSAVQISRNLTRLDQFLPSRRWADDVPRPAVPLDDEY